MDIDGEKSVVDVLLRYNATSVVDMDAIQDALVSHSSRSSRSNTSSPISSS